MKINDDILKSSFGLESAGTGARRGANQEPNSAVQVGLSGWGVETEKAVSSLITSNISNLIDGGVMTKEQRRKANANIASNGIQKLVNKYSLESAFYGSLPKEIKDVTSTPAKVYFKLKGQLSAATEATEKFKLAYRAKQAKIALESALWNVFSSIYNTGANRTGISGMALEGRELMQRMGQIYAPSNGWVAGQESTSVATYTDQIYIPKVSAFNSWYNVASVIMPKVQKTKTVLNEICEIPVSTKIMIAMEKDQDGNIINEWRREELYNKMDMSLTAPGLDHMRTREVKFTTAEFGRPMDFHRDNFSAHGNKPFLAKNEHVGPQLEIVELEIQADSGTTKVKQIIGDTRSGVSQGPALGQLDTKGKYIPVTLDPSKPEEIYHLTFDWDVQNTRLLVLPTASKTTMKPIVGITLKCNMRDLEQTLVSRIAFKIQEERTVLKTPEIDRYVLPIMPEEMDNLAERGSANHLNKLVELTSEYTQHKKESRWIKEYRQMKAVLAAAKYKPNGVVESTILYSHQAMDLNTLGEVRKPESIAYHLGNNLSVLRDKLGKDANTTSGVQLSMFTGTLNLNVISQCLEHITGDINEDSDAKFLGVAQSDRVRAVTIGNSKNSPIQSIVIGTDKSDFNAVGYDTTTNTKIPDADIEYKFEIIPTFQDENIQTTMFLEQPTKVISGSEIRANESPMIPSMIIHEGYKFNQIRGAAADLMIKGVGFRALSD